MATPKKSKQSGAARGGGGGAVAPSPTRLLTREESFRAPPVAIQQQQTNVLYNKPRAAAALVTILPTLMDNPLYEGGGGFSREAVATTTTTTIANPRRGNSSAAVKSSSSSQVFDQVKKPKQQPPLRSSLSRLSLDEAKGCNSSSSPSSRATRPPTRRIQSWSLSSRDYEGMWRTVQENVFKTSTRRDSMSALEDFKQFREKLADLKQTASNEDEVSVSAAPPPTPTVLTPSGSIRSSLNNPNLGSVSTRSLNNLCSPSRRPTSPLQRLSVISSRKGVSGLNPHPQREMLPPRVHRLALSMRAEGLFKLPDPASISPLLTDNFVNSPPPQMLDDSVMNNNTSSATGAASKRRFFTGGRSAAAESKKKPGKGKAGDANSDGDSVIGSWSPRSTPSRSQRRSSSGGGQTTRSSIAAVFGNEVESFMYSCSPRSLAALNTISPRTTPRNSPQQQQQASKKKSEKISVPSSCSPRAKDMKGRCIHIPRTLCYSSHILE